MNGFKTLRTFCFAAFCAILIPKVTHRVKVKSKFNIFKCDPFKKFGENLCCQIFSFWATDFFKDVCKFQLSLTTH